MSQEILLLGDSVAVTIFPKEIMLLSIIEATVFPKEIRPMSLPRKLCRACSMYMLIPRGSHFGEWNSVNVSMTCCWHFAAIANIHQSVQRTKRILSGEEQRIVQSLAEGNLVMTKHC